MIPQNAAFQILFDPVPEECESGSSQPWAPRSAEWQPIAVPLYVKTEADADGSDSALLQELGLNQVRLLFCNVTWALVDVRKGCR